MNEILLNTRLRIYIAHLKLKNDDRKTALNNNKRAGYNRAILTQRYDCTVEIIKELETILNECQ